MHQQEPQPNTVLEVFCALNYSQEVDCFFQSSHGFLHSEPLTLVYSSYLSISFFCFLWKDRSLSGLWYTCETEINTTRVHGVKRSVIWDEMVVEKCVRNHLTRTA